MALMCGFVGHDFNFISSWAGSTAPPGLSVAIIYSRGCVQGIQPNLVKNYQILSYWLDR